MIILDLIISILIADFISGLAHFIEDRYFTPKLKGFFLDMKLAMISHHEKPRAFLDLSFWERNSLSLRAMGLLIVIGVDFWVTSPIFYFTCLLLSVMNEFHTFSHKKRNDNVFIVRMFQKVGLIQSQKHHNLHHGSPFDVHYCILTEYLNPILDRINFWYRLERILFLINIKSQR